MPATQKVAKLDAILVAGLGVHGEQKFPPGGDVEPLGQAAHEVALLVLDDVPAGHLVHAEEPVDMLKVPCD